MPDPRPGSQSFFNKVYAVARKIPRGRVTSYGAIAAALGAPRSARMVGWAMNGSGRVTPPVPAHRVVNREGALTGARFFGGETAMKDMLESEGIRVRKHRVVDFRKVFWDPVLEMKKRR